MGEKLKLIGVLLTSLAVGLFCALYIPLFDLMRWLAGPRPPHVFIAFDFEERRNLIFE